MASFVTGGGAQSPIEWEWMDDRRRWVSYDAFSSSVIESSFSSGGMSAVVSSAQGGRTGTGATYTIHFSSMQQVNNASRFVRNVRRNVVGAPSHETWEWKKNGSRWEAVPVPICLQISASRDLRGETSTTAHINGLAHEFDFTQMTVTRLSVGVVVQLRLRASRGAAAGAAAAAAAAGVGAGASARGMSTRSGASASPSPHVSTNGDRSAEYERIINEATDCTATASANNETCTLCMDPFSPQEPALLLSQCQGHYMHAPCIMQVFKAMGPKCPTCSKMYGPLHGDQPDGTMTVRTHRRGAIPLSGYESDGTILIQYSFPSGTQSSKHPNPGSAYHGTSRTAYLPDNAAGREVLALLRKSFDQRMTFTVGTSITTGRSNCVIWNGVHHKTNTTGGSSSFGYPDPGYFGRVKAELLAKGIQ
ncbi:unnamed protein product [Ectocarpus sp. CCAP 1310/34]|nr:unnamed protein product [Ectocarpus sp. CCAP 1310/34]